MAERVTSQLLSLVTKEVLPIQLLCIKILWALSTDAPAAKEIAAKVRVVRCRRVPVVGARRAGSALRCLGRF
jgi:hypothetical protein